MRELQHYTLENPWPTIVCLIVAWAILRLVGRQRGKASVRRAGYVPLLLAAGLALVAHFVETRAEKLLLTTDRFFTATVGPDLPTIDAIIDPGAIVSTPSGMAIPFAQARERIQEVRLIEQEYDIGEVALADNTAAMTLRARTKWSEDFPPTSTTWVFSWRWTGSEWQLRQLEWVGWANQSPDAVWDAAVR